ncbi:3,4-dihydroxy-2-butanone 4-phosphate synthase [Russula earlei]|uniref:3,4-dihydroxy-2-butanone 4-phosphate synthase n=1 Tax=Russula earlei TaxID=71964 RepID=A0ACC0UFE9_9AGAM|nr:3,4-dihydroxy-2-butanone 4-phosphate synthase [Russula earlei]
MAPVAVLSQVPDSYASMPPVPDLADLSSPPRRAPKERTPSLRTSFAFDAVETAIAAIARGEFVVVMDDESRENEGDLIIPAVGCSTEQMAWMIKHTSGYICISLPAARLDALSIPMMVPQNEERHRTAYTVTVDYKHGTPPAFLPLVCPVPMMTDVRPGTSTGISAHDRALTARALAAPTALHAQDFTRPGHMVPLRARPGGVLTRRGHTEAAVDLCTLAGLPRAGLLCELVNDDEVGSMMRRDACRAFADRFGLPMISVAMLVEHVERTQRARAQL